MAQQKRVIPSLESRMDELRANRVSGAVELALEALDLSTDWLAAGRSPADLAKALRSMHPAIAPLANVARLIEESPANLSLRLTETKTSLLQGNQSIARNLQKLISPGSRIITLSNSSTVREALFGLAPAAVYVMHSLPGGEGEGQARDLRGGFSERGVAAHIEIVPDTALANIVPLVDCALVGIDSYDRVGAILHKVGTLPLALCCRQFAKRFYSAGHSLKLSDHEFQGLPDPRVSPGEQWFDCTPPELITSIVTEKDAG